MTANKHKLTYGDVAILKTDTFQGHRDGDFVSICGIRETEKGFFYVVEFGDGSSMEVSESVLEPYVKHAEPNIKVTREYLRRMLIDWQEGLLTTSEIHSFALKYFRDDIEAEDDATHEILGMLDMLDMNFLCNEDIPYLIDLLSEAKKTLSAEEVNAGYKEYMSKIDLEKRKEKLCADAIYAPFCKK